VLFFMTGECGSCIEGARTLDAIERQYGDRLAVLAVDMDPGATTAGVRAFAEAAGRPRYEFARDPDGRMVGAFAVRALDTVVITDADGAVVYRGVSPDRTSLQAVLSKAGVV
jgi:thiol-disulfide isomerase/thioredoxin